MDLTASVLTIRESKFYKTRLVPMGPALTGAIAEYVAQRSKEHPTQLDGALFLTRTGTPVARHTAENVFSRLRVRAGVVRPDGGRYQPRLHDLRHAFAVHRLISWYRQGADVQRLLPQLATYLGHVHIAATQRYLTLTPELLHEASQRAERYAQGNSMNDKALLGSLGTAFSARTSDKEANSARNTQRSYRDALSLLIPFVAAKLHQTVDRLDGGRCIGGSDSALPDRSGRIAGLRHCHSQSATGQRLMLSPASWESTVRNTLPGVVRSVRSRLRGPARQSSPIWTSHRWTRCWPRRIAKPAQGRRDHALLLFLYNSGARADEAAQLLIGELDSWFSEDPR